MSKIPNKIIGRIDKLDIPEFQIIDLACKIDTGAALSSIHCHSVKIVEKDGVEHLKFKLLDPKHPQFRNRVYSTTAFRERKIRSSFGEEQARFSIQTRVLFFGREFDCEFTLADREKMSYPCLLGRNFLRYGFVVDVRKSNLSYKLRDKK